MTMNASSRRPRRRIAALAGVAAISLVLGLAGCGDSASTGSSADTIATTGAATSAAVGQDTAADATAAVSKAYATLQASSYKSTATTTQELDASAVAESVRSTVEEQMRKSLSDNTNTLTVESPTRRAMSGDVAGKTTQVVVYDGQVFFSPNGTKWAELTGAAGKAIAGANQLANTDPAELFTGLHPDGTETVNGQAGTRYAGTVSADKTTELLSGAFGVMGAEVQKTLGDALSIKDGTVTVVVDDATGNVLKQVITLDFGFDFGAIAKAEGADNAGEIGTLMVASTTTETVTDVGGDITVTKPTATTKVNDIMGLAAFLGS